MSKSVKVKPRRFSDPRDRDYLSLLGTAFHQQKMEGARVSFQSFELPGFEVMAKNVPFLPAVSEAVAPVAARKITGQQRNVLEQLGQACRSVGCQPRINALPSSTGGIVIDLVREGREKVYARREVKNEQDLCMAGRHDDF